MFSKNDAGLGTDYAAMVRGMAGVYNVFSIAYTAGGRPPRGGVD